MNGAPGHFRGLPASRGMAWGSVHYVDRSMGQIPRRKIAVVEAGAEMARFERAVAAAVAQLKATLERVRQEGRGEEFAILEAYLLMLKDPVLNREVEKHIREAQRNAEWALRRAAKGVMEMFDKVSDPYLRARRADIEFVADRVMANLMGQDTSLVPPQEDGVVVVTLDLSPADAVTLLQPNVRAIVTEGGSPLSHTAILARTLGIPAVVAVRGICAAVNHGDTIFADGMHGEVVLNPDAETRLRLDLRRREFEQVVEALYESAAEPGVTLDGVHVTTLGNIDQAPEAEDVLAAGGEGVGLFRTEFLYLGGRELPGEQEHYQAYVALLKLMQGRMATIRTLDLGGDKVVPAFAGVAGRDNPALGLRAIRFSLSRPDVFRVQLRALLRAAAHGPLQVMFPMVSDVQELLQAKALLHEAADELERQGIEHRRDVPVGCLIEVPSAAMLADHFARECDFLSVGTNDLIQYCLAFDRLNEQVADMYRPLHPAILRMLKNISDAAMREDKVVAVCGEMAGEPLCTLPLIGLGITTLSMNAASLPAVKRVIRRSSAVEAHEIASALLDTRTATEAEHVVRDLMRQRFPELAGWQ